MATSNPWWRNQLSPTDAVSPAFDQLVMQELYQSAFERYRTEIVNNVYTSNMLDAMHRVGIMRPIGYEVDMPAVPNNTNLRKEMAWLKRSNG